MYNVIEDKSEKFSLMLFLSLILGILCGIFFKEKANSLSFIVEMYSNLMFTISTPLLFFSIASVIVNIVSLEGIKKISLVSVLVFLSMSSIVIIVTMILMIIFNFANNNINIVLPFYESSFEKVNIFEILVSRFTASNFSELLSVKGIFPLIVFSIFVGISIRTIKFQDSNIKGFLDATSNIMFRVLKFYLYFIPFGVFAFSAVFVGDFYNDIILSNGVSGTALSISLSAVCMLYIFTFVFFGFLYTLYAYISAGWEGVKSLKYASLSVFSASAVDSSLVVLPINYVASKKMNIPSNVSNITLPLGHIIHLEGSSLRLVFEVLFFAFIFNLQTDLAFYLKVYFVAMFYPILTVGIPKANLLFQTIVIGLFQFPVGSLPILLLIGVLIDPLVTILNATSNLIACMLVTRISNGKGWFYRIVDYGNSN
jgi:Na+/H+-dicarboxylate symporter